MKYSPEIELDFPENIKRLQEEQLKKVLKYVSVHSPFYKSTLAANKIDIESISALEDLRKIPPTTKDDLQLHNWDFLCVPRERVAEYMSTSGTLGKPVTIALTANDLERLAYNECISFQCADGSDKDLFQLMITMDRQFMAGAAYYHGIRKLGAGVVRVGPGLPAMQWEAIERLKPTALVAVPSFIIKLIEFAKTQHIDPNRSSVERIVCIGESLRSSTLELNVLGKKITESWNKVKLYSTYASTEMQTAFTECKYGRGGHLHPELMHVELLDQNNFPVRKGEEGEVTITTFGVEGMPLIRYKTGDIAMSFTEKCECGRSTLRLGPILGRRQQMIKLRGTTIYPQGIFEILHQSNHIQDYVVEAFTGALGTDELRIFVAVAHEYVEEVGLTLTASFQTRLRVVPKIGFCSLEEVATKQSGGRKVNRFIDRRIQESLSNPHQ